MKSFKLTNQEKITLEERHRYTNDSIESDRIKAVRATLQSRITDNFELI